MCLPKDLVSDRVREVGPDTLTGTKVLLSLLPWVRAHGVADEHDDDCRGVGDDNIVSCRRRSLLP